MRCFHVTTEKGAEYSVCAHGKREAKQMVQNRITREAAEAVEVGVEPFHDAPSTAEDVGSWPGADYGTVLCTVGPRGWLD